jgi:multiple sugar transport system substrate-binding protein
MAMAMATVMFRKAIPTTLLASFVAVTAGCPSGNSTNSASIKPLQGVEISIAAVGDPKLIELVDAQRGEWEESRGSRAVLRKEPIDPRNLSGVDVVLFRGDQMGALVDAKALAVLPESLVRPPAVPKDDDGSSADKPPPDPMAFTDVAAAQRDLVAKYGPDRMGLPLGGSALVVVYRRDVFESDANRRAAEQAGVAFEPPATWEAFDALAKFLHQRDWSGDGQPRAAVALAWGEDPEGVANATFFARATALGLHKDQFGLLFDSDDLNPRIASPPFVEALEGLTALRAFGPPNSERFDADAARSAFRAGDVALLVDRAEQAALWNNSKKPWAIGVSAMPGSKRVYNPERKLWEKASPPNRPSYLPLGGGWLAGLSSSATGKKREAALNLLMYLALPETASRLIADSDRPMLPVRLRHVAAGPPDSRAAAGLDPRSWSDAVSKTWLATQVSVGPRLPDVEGYLADLSKARVKALAGEPAGAALEEAAQDWKKRSKALGDDRQLWHYRRSLNRLTTSPEPPPKS